MGNGQCMAKQKDAQFDLSPQSSSLTAEYIRATISISSQPHSPAQLHHYYHNTTDRASESNCNRLSRASTFFHHHLALASEATRVSFHTFSKHHSYHLSTVHRCVSIVAPFCFSLTFPLILLSVDGADKAVLPLLPRLALCFSRSLSPHCYSTHFTPFLHSRIFIAANPSPDCRPVRSWSLPITDSQQLHPLCITSPTS